MKIRLELFGASREFSNKDYLDFNINKKISIKDFRQEIINYIKLNFKDNKATEILRAGKVHIPIDKRKKIEGRWSRNGIIRPSKSSLPKEGLPEAVFLQENIAERTFVWETPSEMDIRIRVKAHIAMLDEALGYTIS